MDHDEVTAGREFLGRLEHGADWVTEIESLADGEAVDAGWFTAFGAVQDAELTYYDQDDLDYQSVRFDEPLGVAACVGNVAVVDGDRSARAHVVLSRRSGQTLAGRLDRATVFAGELYLREFEDELVRERDDVTDLPLWL